MQKRTFLAATLLAASGVPAFAQEPAASFPSRPIRLIVNFPAGGSLDIVARSVGQKLAEKLGQPVFVENRPGAGGNIGTQAVATADPDGYTLLVTPPGPLSINQYLYKNMGYDPAQLAPVVVLASVPNAITARLDFPAANVRELVAYVKAHPGKVSYGSQGNGSTSHLTAQMFATMIGGQMVHVPFKGEGPALTELMAGRIDLFFGNIAGVLKYRDARHLKILSLASPRRSSLAPDIPSAVESGLPDFAASAWFAVAAPPGTPAAIADKLNAAIVEILKLPDVKEKLAAQGAEPVGGTPADMNAFVNSERARWKKVIATANVKLE
jgi:tripartite-type tricarboxylate transporter receptor subunit TctC